MRSKGVFVGVKVERCLLRSAHQKEEEDIAAKKRSRAEVEKGTLEVTQTLLPVEKLEDLE